MANQINLKSIFMEKIKNPCSQHEKPIVPQNEQKNGIGADSESSFHKTPLGAA